MPIFFPRISALKSRMAAMIQIGHKFDITIDINLVTIFFQHLLVIKLAMDKNFPVFSSDDGGPLGFTV